MKYLLITLISVAFVSCNFDYLNSVTGNGNVIDKEVKTETFQGIHVSDAMDILVIPSDTQKVVITADENIVDLVKIKVRDDILYVSLMKNVRTARSKQVKVYVKQLETIEASSASTVNNTDSLHYDDLKINCSSAAQIKLKGHFLSLKLEASSAANIKLTGDANELDAHLSSAAGLSASNLIVENASVWASSASNAKINVTKEAHLDASSAANITYWGNPAVKNVTASSGGNINQ